MESISPAQVKAEIKRFWDAFTGKSSSSFKDLYSPTGTVFSVDGRRYYVHPVWNPPELNSFLS